MSTTLKLDETLQKYIRTATFPVAVKISKEPALPPKAKRPMTTFGHPINLCQGIAIARRYGWTMGFLKEDHGCANSLVIMGMVEEPDFIKDGSIVYPLYTENLETGAVTQQATPRMPGGEINSILLAPLHRADFDPDVVLIYGNPGQIVRLVQGALYKTGGTINSKFMGRAACGSEIVTTLLTGECNVIIPGGGEKVFAMTAEDEMVFSVPAAKIDDLIEGLAATHKAGAARIPVPQFGLRAEPEFPEPYKKLEDYCFPK